MEFSDRKRTNPNRRKIEIVQQEGNVMIADITEEPGNVTLEGTPITAEIMTEIAQNAETAVNVAGRVKTLEDDFGNMYDVENNKITANSIKVQNVEATGGLKINEKIVDTIYDQGNGYIRYVNGIQICWGQTAATTDTQDLPVNFPQPFAETNYGLSVGVVYAGSNWTSQIYVYSKTKCGFKYYKYAGSSAPMTWIAIGTWEEEEENGSC